MLSVSQSANCRRQTRTGSSDQVSSRRTMQASKSARTVSRISSRRMRYFAKVSVFAPASVSSRGRPQTVTLPRSFTFPTRIKSIDTRTKERLSSSAAGGLSLGFSSSSWSRVPLTVQSLSVSIFPLYLRSSITPRTATEAGSTPSEPNLCDDHRSSRR